LYSRNFRKLINALLAACNEHSGIQNLQLEADKACVIPLPKRKRKIGNAAGALSSRGAAFKLASNVFTLACAGEVKSVKLAA
jgi:hypothetical protein